MQEVPQPSRRSLLQGLLATLFGWLWCAKTGSAAPLPKAHVLPERQPVGPFSIATYDVNGNCIDVRYPSAEEWAAWVGDNQRHASRGPTSA